MVSKRCAARVAAAVFVAVVIALGAACSEKNPRAGHKVLVLGIDGMDYRITRKLINEGKLPSFGKLAQQGGFRPLLSSIPAQSPVAWSNFITGKNPGGHAIFDFIHRDPETMIPYLSTSRTESPSGFISLFGYRIPLNSGKVELLRKGKAFWQLMDERGIPATIFKIPSNFPPAPFGGKSISGMGTPDILGTYGTFSYYTDNPPENADNVSGGEVYTVWVEENGQVRAEIVGPPNVFLDEQPPPDSYCPFTVYVDKERNAAKIEVGDSEIVLSVGEWSDWVEVEFDMMPGVSTSGIVRFYLKEVMPDFKLYVSPVNIDPMDPAMPISTPDDYSREVAEGAGFFYTQGMPQDTKALDYGVLNDDEYAQQVKLVLRERERLFWNEFGNWDEGLLFFYFSTLDLNQHTWWRAMDPKHPLYTKELGAKYGDFIYKLYMEIDKIVGKVMERLGPDDTLIVMSDHGFASYRRKFNLNTWLLENGYIKLEDTATRESVEYLEGVDWENTRAYALGINAVYINLAGRERNGVVSPAEADGLAREIASKLEKVKDPETGRNPVRKAYISKDVFRGEYVDKAPDIIVGYRRGYRGSDDSALGRFPKEVFADNKDKWSGDHCIDPHEVPGVLIANKGIAMEKPALYDLTVTVLKEYGIEPLPGMIGKPVW